MSLSLSCCIWKMGTGVPHTGLRTGINNGILAKGRLSADGLDKRDMTPSDGH